jgi:hypothetical protein
MHGNKMGLLKKMGQARKDQIIINATGNAFPQTAQTVYILKLPTCLLYNKKNIF